MNQHSLLRFAVLISCLCLTGQAHAGNAELLLAPTRLVLENGAHFASVTVKNNGDGTGRYKVDIVDASMAENGGIQLLPDGTKNQDSAIDYLSFSPKSITLKPDENQTIRILVKDMNALPDGEYRSHLRVKMVESDLNPAPTQAPKQGAGIALKAKMTTVIPVIVRKGQMSYNLTVDDIKLNPSNGENKAAPQATVALGFSGNRSVLGDVKISHIGNDGKETEIALFRGIAVYRGLAKRSQIIPLDKIPPGVNIHTGLLRVTFMTQENEGSKIVSSKDFTP